ncbi:MAG: M15 family metallopeptidase [Minisyncoccia bacterium]
MKDFKDFKFDSQVALLAAIIIALPLAGYAAYQYRALAKDYRLLSEENIVLEHELGVLKNNYSNLEERSTGQQAIIDSFGGQIEGLSSTVGVLDKLAKTDKELLQKYSKVYFLNEHYVPDALTEIDDNLSFNQSGGNLLIHDKVAPFLKELILEALEDGVNLLVVSAFRSFDTQASLKAEYRVTYGEGTANQFSADQGYSEHQLGTSIDFTTKELGASFTKFGSSEALKWLEDNAHKYGFILSYPANNGYYRYEPWHWRFVGVDLATRLREEGKYFYDWDQREINKFLVKIFD